MSIDRSRARPGRAPPPLQASPPAVARPRRRSDASKRRSLVLCLALACGLLCWPPAWASPPDRRLDPQERDRLRHDLRQQGREDRDFPRDRRQFGPADPSGPASGDWPARDRGVAPSYPYGGAMPRGGEPGRDPGGAPGRGGFAGPQAEPRERMSPEERRQLRLQLRERHRSPRD